MAEVVETRERQINFALTQIMGTAETQTPSIAQVV